MPEGKHQNRKRTRCPFRRKKQRHAHFSVLTYVRMRIKVRSLRHRSERGFERNGSIEGDDMRDRKIVLIRDSLRGKTLGMFDILADGGAG